MINPSDFTPEFLEENGIPTKNLVFGPSFLPYNPNLKLYSRDLRNESVMAEILLWKQLRGKRTGYTFNRQKPILNYIADFYCKTLDLVIEIDGYSHFSAGRHKRDVERDRQMSVLGLKVIRVLDREVKANPSKVVSDIFCMLGHIDSPLPPLRGGMREATTRMAPPEPHSGLCSHVRQALPLQRKLGGFPDCSVGKQQKK